MTIDISGDVIYFDGHPVGCITVPNGTLRGEFEEALQCVGDTSEADELRKLLQDEEVGADEMHDRIERALACAKSDEPDWQKLIEILS